MRIRSLLLALLAALAIHPAWAALSVTTGQSPSGNPPGTCTIAASVGTGQVILVMTQGTPPADLTVTDNKNAGDYSLLASYSAPSMGIFWIKTNASGAPAISLSGTTGYTYLWCFAVTGFVGTPTVDSALTNTATGSGTALAINATSNHNNEVMLVHVGEIYSHSVTVSGWSEGTGGGDASASGFYSIEASAGTANNFAGTWSASGVWYLLLAGIYDLPSGTCTHAGITAAGGIAVPNGTSGSYRLANGTFGTPDCASIPYPNTAGGIAVN